MSYLLYVDDKPTTMHETLDQAKQEALPMLSKEVPLRIESLVAPARSQIWVYDSNVNDWAEKV